MCSNEPLMRGRCHHACSLALGALARPHDTLHAARACNLVSHVARSAQARHVTRRSASVRSAKDPVPNQPPTGAALSHRVFAEATVLKMVASSTM